MATADTEGIRAADSETEKVTLSTIHQAKGLEWRVVFVIWLTDGMFPSSRSLLSTEAIEEERRLFYVASTRAQDQLSLTYPYYSFNGSPENRLQRPSRFLKEIPPDLVEELWVTTRRGTEFITTDFTDYTDYVWRLAAEEGGLSGVRRSYQPWSVKNFSGTMAA